MAVLACGGRSGGRPRMTPAQARFLAKDTRWLRMDEGKDRIVEAQVNIANNTIDLSADDRRRRIEELQQKVLTNAIPIMATKPQRMPGLSQPP